MPDRTRHQRAGEQPVPVECHHHLRHAMWQLRSDHAAADAYRREVRLVAEPLDQFGRATEHVARVELAQNRPRVKIYDDVLLRVELTATNFAKLSRQAA